MIDDLQIKKNFPLLQTYPDLIFVDNASTTQKPLSVIDSIHDYYTKNNANIHRAVYDLGVQADHIYEEARDLVIDFFGQEQCVFTSGTTDGINKIARAVKSKLKTYSNIIVSEMEHHSNLVPWQELCKERGCELRIARITPEGELDMNHFFDLVDHQTQLVSLVHVSNTLGTINDLKAIAHFLHDKDCIFIVDAAQSCALHREEISEIEADAFIFSAHKMFGPTGVGAIIGSQDFFDTLDPFNFGGGMVTEVDEDKSSYRDSVQRFEGGTPPVAQVAGFRTAIEFLKSLDLGQCKAHVAGLAADLRQLLSEDDVAILGNPSKSSGIVSLNINGIHPHDVASFLNDRNIAVRAGHHCTQLIMKKYHVFASVRFSFSIYNNRKEVDQIVKAIRDMHNFFL